MKDDKRHEAGGEDLFTAEELAELLQEVELFLAACASDGVLGAG